MANTPDLQEQTTAPPQSEHLDNDESSTTTDDPSTPKPKKNKSKKKKSTIKSPELTEEEQDLYNTHAEEIRQNAMQLLNADTAPGAQRYKSYHDNPPAATNFVSSESTNVSSLPPWNAQSSFGNTQSTSYGADDTLSVSQVATMAFSCIAHCLTEGYRAASNYYSTYDSQDGGFDQQYSKVGSEGGNGYLNGGGGYQDGYQQQMDRGLNQSSGQGTEQIESEEGVRVQGEYVSVKMPSTYQGGNRG